MLNIINIINKMMLTTNHKIIGILYGYIGYNAGILGFIISMLIRIELSTTGLGLIRKIKEIIIYNNWITIHGLIMLFVFIMPIGIGLYGNYLIPILIGTSELSMPKINGIGFYLLLISVILFIYCNILINKSISCGWTLYPPLSNRDIDNIYINIDINLLIIHILGISSTIGSINFITTNKYNRHNGLILLDINIYNYSIIITSILLIGALPVLGISIVGLLLDRNYNTNIYDIIGDPILYQHLFWYFGHPEVYVIILPIFGLVSLILTSIIHNNIFGREGMIYCIISIGIIGYFVWAHHMFVIGLDLDTRSYFSIATSIISIPTSIKIFSYINTWSSSIGFIGSNMSYAFFSFILTFCFGGFTGLILSTIVLDILLTDTFFVVGHFHTVLSLSSSFGLFLALSFFFTLFFVINIFESLIFFILFTLIFGAFIVFYPMHLAGIVGLARRIPEFADFFLPFIILSTHGAIILIFFIFLFFRGFFIPFFNSFFFNLFCINTRKSIRYHKFVIRIFRNIIKQQRKDLHIYFLDLNLFSYKDHCYSIFIFNNLIYHHKSMIKLLRNINK
jgi:heme/copper-type cytochrome/quinol oxidase subunit 1